MYMLIRANSIQLLVDGAMVSAVDSGGHTARDLA